MGRFFIFISILSLIMGLGYFYLGSKFIHSSLNSQQKIISWFFVILLWACTPGFYFLSSYFPNSNLNKIYSLLAFLNFGFFTIVLFLVLMGDVGVTIYYYISNYLTSTPSEEQTTGMESRREFLFRFWKPTMLGLGIAITGYGFYNVSRKVSIEEVNIPIENLKEDLEGFTIVQISDVHVGSTIKIDFIQYLVNSINELNADLIAITGDLVDGPASKLKSQIQPLKDLKSKFGTFFVTGNHEYYSGALSWITELKNLGINVLLNEHRIIKKGNSNLLVGGVTDYSTRNFGNSHASDPFECLKDAGHSDFKVLLAHQPKSIYEAEKAGFDLQLSGHTHGGQYFPGNFLIYLFQPFVKGLYKHLNTWIYVSKGTGYWGPPIRVGADPEITIIKLKKK